jgi:hypothetical protein
MLPVSKTNVMLLASDRHELMALNAGAHDHWFSPL